MLYLAVADHKVCNLIGKFTLHVLHKNLFFAAPAGLTSAVEKGTSGLRPKTGTVYNTIQACHTGGKRRKILHCMDNNLELFFRLFSA